MALSRAACRFDSQAAFPAARPLSQATPRAARTPAASAAQPESRAQAAENVDPTGGLGGVFDPLPSGPPKMKRGPATYEMSTEERSPQWVKKERKRVEKRKRKASEFEGTVEIDERFPAPL